MPDFKSIMNVGLVAHVDASKTTLTESLLYHAGVTRQLGKVDEGTALTDNLQVEKERGISVKAASVSFIHNDVRLNLLDTPGHVDFVSEVERALSVLDTAVLVISAVEGIQAQTEVLYEALKAQGTNIVIFINKIDRVGSDSQAVMKKIRETFTPHLLPLNQILAEETREATCQGLTPSSTIWQEVSADFDEELLEAYLDGKELSEHHVLATLKEAIRKRELVPVVFGSSLHDVGVDTLLNALSSDYFLSKNIAEQSEKLSGIVWRISHDKTMGRLAHVRLFGGKIKVRDSVSISKFRNDSIEEEPKYAPKVTQIRRYQGEKFNDLSEAIAGDVVALCGLADAEVGDIIGQKPTHISYPLAIPLLEVGVSPATPEVIEAFRELSAEDPQLNSTYDLETRELNITITGRIQLEILSQMVQERYGLEVTFTQPTVIYKETPTGIGYGHEVYTMPKPCWAVIDLKIEPLPIGSGIEFESIVSDDDMHYKYQSHIAAELPRALKQGVYNWEVTDIKVTLIGGEHHRMHTHPLDFFLATPLAVIDGLQNAGMTLLEPMQKWRITADESLIGKIIGDLIQMRATYGAPQISEGICTLEARVPVATSLDYPIRLASLSSGKAVLSVRFDGYQPCRLEDGAIGKRRGVDPRDRDKWILVKRSAMSG
ncbi:GTP-binding protein [Streptococcus hillyeri]|nr:TetM/TetW/TetO/TetS family tetracycline resistance ribosomal protection protein [Streptococcus hillyeri]